jgi:peptide/nickel transport system substrate-binding protein
VRNSTRSKLSVAALLTTVLAVSACSPKSSSGNTAISGSASATDSSSGGALQPASNINNTGTPVKGGELDMLGTGDVDYMDPNISYYTTGYMAARMYSRQLLTYPADPAKVTQTVPDMAKQLPTQDNGGISADGLTIKFKIKDGVKWDTTPARQVTGADFVRGIKRVCNPAQPMGGLPDFETLLKGYQAFCDGFAKVDPKSASAIAAYQNSHDFDGVKVDPSDPNGIIFTLTHPASYFISMLSLTAFSPAPKEYDAYIPASADLAQHTISDGPYKITKYDPAKEIDFARNPAWDGSTDDIRKAYVDTIKVTETGDQTAEQQQLQADTPDADMWWDNFPPVTVVPQLIQSHDPNFYLGQTFSSNPYIVFNTVSPNNNNALQNVKVRQALMEAINRDTLIQDLNGPQVSPPLTHVLPAGISGTTSNNSIDLYKYDPNKAKQDLAAAGFPNGLTLKFLLRPSRSSSVKIFTTLQQDLKASGINLEQVGVPDADFYTKYLQVPAAAKAGKWDVSLAGWGPDWYGDAALSFFAPLFQGKSAFPPNGSNYGFYDNPQVNAAIDAASKEVDPTKSAAAWAAVDQQVMQDAPFFPITTNNQGVYHPSHTHNAIFLPYLQGYDMTNVWLSK